ncbi:hypothetical protein IB275_30365 [Pseudomonas sp. PDM21]|uniref:hypothetical protein n=1 Tax=Pseudomonas sp. PDM21 TaxID=2769257 RepID=UPI00177AD950|nr:hypothetical protein [Pseudomonas sp. PDM21]MBD9674920.1 hypothetical protein [Pseudomonas sp. PDM21]
MPNTIPDEPSLGLLVSIACRLDHGLLVPGHYDRVADQFAGIPHPTHLQVFEARLADARRAYEEIAGHGFYRFDREDEYVALLEAARAGA